MNSVRNLRVRPASLPLLAEDLIEFHASRILLLLLHCGRKSKLDGLTKLAKLDFFVRYPDFFERACQATGQQATIATSLVESKMVKFHYGPWDRRYYHVFSYLEARDLIQVSKSGNSFVFELTGEGTGVAEALSNDQAFADLVSHMREVGRVFGRKNGTALKDLIYQTFQEEVALRELGREIQP